MKNTEFKKALKRANNAESKLKSSCDDLCLLFEPYFSCEISVLYQDADGFVILYDMEEGNLNEPVENAFKNICENKTYYK